MFLAVWSPSSKGREVSIKERRRSVRFVFDGPLITAAIESPQHNFRVTGFISDISRHGCKLIGKNLIGQHPRRGDDILIEFIHENQLETHPGILRRLDTSMGCLILGAEFLPPLQRHAIDAMFPESIGRVVCHDVKKHSYVVEGMLGEMVFKPISWIAKRYRSSAILDLRHVDRWDSKGLFAVALARQYGVAVINIPKGMALHEVSSAGG